MRNFYKYLPVVLLVVAGCSGDETVMPLDAEYFPLRKGFYQVYNMHETVYTRIGESQAFQYQLKTEVVDSFVNQLEGYTYTIHRSRRNTVSDPWVFQQVWSVRLTSASVVVSEENIPFVKIVFPAMQNRRWNGNALNTLPADEYRLTETGKAYPPMSGTAEGEFIRIVQEDSGDLFHINKREEVYVRNIGLVHREIRDLEYCSDADECDITQQVIDNGTVYVQTLTEYGQN